MGIYSTSTIGRSYMTFCNSGNVIVRTGSTGSTESSVMLINEHDFSSIKDDISVTVFEINFIFRQIYSFLCFSKIKPVRVFFKRICKIRAFSPVNGYRRIGSNWNAGRSNHAHSKERQKQSGFFEIGFG